MNAIKVEYVWYEGEYDEVYVVFEDFNKLKEDIKSIQKEIDEDGDIGYAPNMFEYVRESLRSKGYVIIDYLLENESIDIDDGYKKKVGAKGCIITHHRKKTEINKIEWSSRLK